jgi:cbb3-type cytochrome oxidase cytochrome c subunit
MGGVLVRTRGCLECHRLGEQGPRAGVDLYGAGRHLSAEAIERLLLYPQEVNPEATMPQPTLTRAEAQTIADFLARPGR